MKKLLSFILCVALMGGVCNGFVLAADKDDVAGVLVTVYCENDGLVECNDAFSVGVSDRDNDGVITVADALNATHFEYCAYDDGYATKETEEGLEIAKLWGFEAGVCGIYVNHKPVANLLAEVKDGDRVYAYRLDSDAEPKKYCYFDKTKAKFSENELSLTLTVVELDDKGNHVVKPLEGATITIDGKPYPVKTDADGKVTLQRITFELTMTCNFENQVVINARSDSGDLLPPVCRVKYPEFELPFIDITIADAKGDIVVYNERISNVPDWDGDGKRTVNDALISIHEDSFEDGAAEGYSTKKEKEKLTIQKLWGNEIDGKCEIYVNHKPASGLLQKLKNGDNIYFFCYQDTENLSDKYCYFQDDSIFLDEGEEATLCLEMYDDFAPVADATILIDGQESEFKTNSDGEVTITLAPRSSAYIISAKSDTLTLVPPFCRVYVMGDQEGGFAAQIQADADSASSKTTESKVASSKAPEASKEKEESKVASSKAPEVSDKNTETKVPSKEEDKSNDMISPQTGIDFPFYPLILSLVFLLISLITFKKFSKE